MRYRDKILFFFLLIFGFVQSQQVTGLVTNSQGEPVENAAIFLKKTGTHTHTGTDGTFELTLPQGGDILYVSHLGYEPRELSLDGPGEQLTIVLNEAPYALEQIVLNPQLNPINEIANVDLELNPVTSSQQILRLVPGLMIGQHAGGGKAEQIFLRGFDIDHGTDINLTVDGLPVNMVSHAHGQGYSDLHFIIPETLQKIEFGKGPYFVERGDFATAGYVAFRTKDYLEKSSVSMEYGDFETFRTTALLDITNTANHKAYVASSFNTFNGPFDSPQNFYRFNLLGKYTVNVSPNDKVGLNVSHFQSKWNASGQIPQRAVDRGIIGRFGAIDDTEGGETSRTNVSFNYRKRFSDSGKLEHTTYYSAYDFELFSNFTFFLEDPVNGDQIKQSESRNLIGTQTKYTDDILLFGKDVKYTTGTGLRYDMVNDVGLFRTLNRSQVLSSHAYGNINQLNIFSFLSSTLDLGKLTINTGLRFDHFNFEYEDFLTENDLLKSTGKSFISPKLNFIYTVNDKWQFSLKSGIGFHSNDARVATARNGEEVLPAAYGADLIATTRIGDNFILNFGVWGLHLDQEFVYVGDAGIVEPSGRSRRLGADLGFRFEPTKNIYVFSDLNYTYARSIDEPDTANYIPLAPDFTSTGGITFETDSGFSGGINYRFMKDRPANEDNSIVAEGYWIADSNINYNYKNFVFSLIVENLFNTEWNETQFATESRLADEVEPTEEIHFTPGTPFFLRGKVTVNF